MNMLPISPILAHDFGDLPVWALLAIVAFILLASWPLGVLERRERARRERVRREREGNSHDDA